MVTGSPGIGKSYFYLYAIFRFIKDPSLLGKWRLVINSGEHFHILNGDTFEAVHPPEILAIQSEKNILRLVDGKTAPGKLTGWKGSTVLLASPCNASLANRLTDLMKGYESYYFFMPVWDDEVRNSNTQTSSLIYLCDNRKQSSWEKWNWQVIFRDMCS